MISKTFTFVDYNGTERKETHWFNLNKAELVKMEMSISGGFAEMINRIIAAKDQTSIIAVFEDLIEKSYGVKTPDGRGFDKDPKHFAAFKCTEAYSQLFMELATDADAAAEFVNGIIPAEMAKQVTQQQAAIAN